jgi:hypothetical protein
MINWKNFLQDHKKVPLLDLGNKKFKNSFKQDMTNDPETNPQEPS